MSHWTMEEDRPKLWKFSGKAEDFPLWKRAFEAFMQLKKLRKYIEPGWPKLTGSPEEKVAISENYYTLWSYLMTYLDTGTANTIESECVKGEGSAAYQTLLSIYEKQDLLRMANLRDELARTYLKKGGNLEDYMSKIILLASKIRQGEGQDTISENAVVARLLSGLPDSFLPFIYQKNRQKNLTTAILRDELRSNVNFAKQHTLNREEEDEKAAFLAWWENKTPASATSATEINQDNTQLRYHIETNSRKILNF